MSEHALSTSDNPYNPWTQWDDWFTWDFQRYDSLGLLAHTIRTSDELPKSLQDAAAEEAIDTIVTQNYSGVHIKVEKPSGFQESNG